MAYEGNPDWPTIFGTGIVTGKYVDSNGSPLQGDTLQFTPRPAVLNATNDSTIVVAAPLVVTLDARGAFSVELPATDDTNVSPVRWTWEVVEQWSGGRTFDISVPVGVTSNMLDLAPVQDSTGIMRYIGPPGPPGRVLTVAAVVSS